MKWMCVSLVVLASCVSVYGAPIWTLTADDTTPVNGQTVTFTLNYNGLDAGTAGADLGLILARFDAGLSGTGTWNTPTNPDTLLSALEAHATASPGTAVVNGVNDVVLAINYTSLPWTPDNIGAAGGVNIWSAQVQVFGSFGQTVTMTATTENHADAGAHAFFSNGSAITTTTQLDAETVTVVPEPVTLVTLGLGSLVIFGRRRFGRKAA